MADKGRRRFLLATSMAGAAWSADSAMATPGVHGSMHNDGPSTYVIDDTSAVADTESGKVVGYIRNDIRTFKGIPYAEILSPEGRWTRAAKPKPWAGKRSSRGYGPVCPTASAYRPATPQADEGAFRSTGDNGRPAEDCLRVNIWTPGLDGKKRRVLFWLHGGGYSIGSPQMASEYDGENLARHGDVVVVSITHRLHALGFLNLTQFGSRWAESANIGMLDAVDGLKWVRDNIANFGGDPAKVMIFGHSGGGSKAGSLLAMPEAKGLFDRAVMQSSGPLPLATPEQAEKQTAAFLKVLNIAPNNVEALLKLPVATLATAAGTFANDNWKPFVDGKTVAYEPTEPNAPSTVPLMIGSALHEFGGALGHPEYDDMPEKQAREIVIKALGEAGDHVFDVYKAAFPRANAFEVSSIATASQRFRANAVKLAMNRAAVKAAPTYLYWFQWQAKILGGRAKSHHGLELPFVFMNTDHSAELTGGTAEARALASKISDAWLAFARTGDPNHKALPKWAPVEAKSVTEMVFNTECRTEQHPDAAALEAIWKSKPVPA